MRVSVNMISGSGHAGITCRAMAEGISRCGDTAIERLHTDHDMTDFDAAVLWGFWEPCQQLVKVCVAAGKPWVFIDLAYWGRSQHYKVVVNDRHPTAYFQRTPRPHDRLKRLDLEIKPWRGRSRGKYILVAGMSGKAAWSWGLAAEEYESAVITELRKFTDRPIVYRPKPSWKDAKHIPGTIYDKTSSIGKLLQNSWAVVTHHSNVGCDALISGVPVFAKYGVASVMGLQDISKIEEPLYSDGRDQWAADVAYCQWTLDEMQSGVVWRHLRGSGLV